MAALVMMFGAGTAYADAVSADFSSHSFAPAGAGTMLRLRIPFGAHDEKAPSRLTLSAGPVWREEERAPLLPAYHQSSQFEVGVSLSGKPLARLGDVDLLEKPSMQLDAEEHKARKVALIILGVTVATAAILALTYVKLQNDCNNNSCTGGVPVTH